MNLAAERKALLLQIANVLGDVLLFALFLFVPAWSLNWWQAWVLLAVMLGFRISGRITVHKINRELLAERSKVPLQKGQPLTDKALLIGFMASYAAQVAFVSFDRFHLHLLPLPPLYACLPGLILFGLGQWMITEVFKTNAFAATVVRHQQEREHVVIETGLYSHVRHPMYAAGILLMVGMGLWLGSLAGLIFSLLPTGILMLRIRLEEKFLCQELEGYAAYRAKTPWRLIPGLW